MEPHLTPEHLVLEPDGWLTQVDAAQSEATFAVNPHLEPEPLAPKFDATPTQTDVAQLEVALAKD